MDEDQINKVIASWLSKKGFKAAKNAFMAEAGIQDIDQLAADRFYESSIQNLVLFHENTPNVGARYIESFGALKDWVDKSLDRYKVELMGFLFPLFVHCVLDLLAKGLPGDASAFLKKYVQLYAMDHVDVVNKLKALVSLGSAGESALQKLSENAEFVELRNHRMPVSLSAYAFRLLFLWLLDGRHMLLLGILNAYVDIKVVSAAPDLDGQDFRFFESSSNPKPIMWKRLGAPKSDDPSVLKRSRTDNEDDKVKSEVPLPPSLPLAVIEAQEEDARIAAIRSSKALPSIAMLTFYHSQGDLNCVAVSDDGSMVAAGLGDSSLRLWNMRNEDSWKAKQPGAAVASNKYHSLIGHGGPTYGASFSPCNRYLLSSSEDSTVRLWGLETSDKSPLVVYRGHNFPVWDVSFSPLGYYFATASHDHTARIFSTDNVFPLRILAGHLSDVDCVAWHPNCNYVATGSADNTIRLWEVNTGECVRIFTGHVGAIYDLAFSPDGSMLASAGDDTTIGIWDLGTSKGISVLRGHTKSVWSLSYSTNGNILASGGGDNKVVLWDLPGALSEKRHVVTKGNEYQLGTYNTKRTPVSLVTFSRRNMLFAAGEFAEK